ncbi:zinc finger protein weckle-like [Anopheles nili]|uniref:zinc finger protein weckle-like n=1 Tax=Anopheles nili TaxID=185578 RepID=UPI00237AAE8D|nr:zinc finger protein weckle-like [Anopheles nili]
MLANWKTWCRMCASQKATLTLESVDKVNVIISTMLSDMSIKELEEMPPNICEDCCSFMTTLKRFREKCQQSTRLFLDLMKRSAVKLEENEIAEIRSKYLEDEDLEDVADRLEEDLDVDAQQLLDIVQDTPHDEDMQKMDGDIPEVFYKVESITISPNQEAYDTGATDTEQWEMLEVEVDNFKNEKETNDENNASGADSELKKVQARNDRLVADIKNTSTIGSNRDAGVRPKRPRGRPPLGKASGKRGFQCATEMDDFDNEPEINDENKAGLLEKDPEYTPHNMRSARTRKPQFGDEEINGSTKRSRGRPSFSKSVADQGFQCSMCPKRYSSSSYLKRHESSHGTGEENLLCLLCDRMFSKAKNVQAHMRMVHKGKKPFICEECGKTFGSKGALKEHYIVHTEETPFQCSLCTKTFKNAARLKTHEDTHNNTLYVCPHCGLKLNTKRTLGMHMVVHSEQKKFKCHECGNEFKRSKALKSHLILHTGLRPYQCPFCDRTFANGSNCRSHKKRFHPRELAALEASGGQKSAVNIPHLDQLQRK